MRSTRGFTAIEFVVVLMIIAIITLIAIPALDRREREVAQAELREQFKTTFGIQLPEREDNILTEKELAAIRPSVSATLEQICEPWGQAQLDDQEHRQEEPPTDPSLAQEHLDRLFEIYERLKKSQETCMDAHTVRDGIPGLKEEPEKEK